MEPQSPRTFPEEGAVALVQQAGGQQSEVGHGVGLHGAESRVCHDRVQRLLAQRPAQKLAYVLQGAAEVLRGPGRGGQGGRAEGGDPRRGRSTRPRIWMSESPTQSRLGGSAALPQFPHHQAEGWGDGFREFSQAGGFGGFRGWEGRGRAGAEVSWAAGAQSPLTQVRSGGQPVCAPDLHLPPGAHPGRAASLTGSQDEIPSPASPLLLPLPPHPCQSPSAHRLLCSRRPCTGPALSSPHGPATRPPPWPPCLQAPTPKAAPGPPVAPQCPGTGVPAPRPGFQGQKWPGLAWPLIPELNHSLHFPPCSLGGGVAENAPWHPPPPGKLPHPDTAQTSPSSWQRSIVQATWIEGRLGGSVR